MKKYIQYLVLFASVVLASSAFAVNFGMFGEAAAGCTPDLSGGTPIFAIYFDDDNDWTDNYVMGTDNSYDSSDGDTEGTDSGAGLRDSTYASDYVYSLYSSADDEYLLFARSGDDIVDKDRGFMEVAVRVPSSTPGWNNLVHVRWSTNANDKLYLELDDAGTFWFGYREDATWQGDITSDVSVSTSAWNIIQVKWDTGLGAGDYVAIRISVDGCMDGNGGDETWDTDTGAIDVWADAVNQVYIGAQAGEYTDDTWIGRVVIYGAANWPS